MPLHGAGGLRIVSPYQLKMQLLHRNIMDRQETKETVKIYSSLVESLDEYILQKMESGVETWKHHRKAIKVTATSAWQGYRFACG